MTINHQENSHQGNKQQEDPNMLNQANDSARSTTIITNPEPALVAAAQAEGNHINNQSNHEPLQSAANSKVKDASEFGKVAVVYGGTSNERSVS